MIQFDYIIFFRWVGSTTNKTFISFQTAPTSLNPLTTAGNAAPGHWHPTWGAYALLRIALRSTSTTKSAWAKAISVDGGFFHQHPRDPLVEIGFKKKRGFFKFFQVLKW